MIKQTITKVFGSRFQRELKRLQPIVDDIKRHEERLASFSEDELKAQTGRLREMIAERIGAQQEELDRVGAAKHECPDPTERQVLEDQFQELDAQYRKALAVVLDDLLPEAFATVREACRRLMGTPLKVTGNDLTWDMVPYDVQLIGGIVLHQGKIAEMVTGEGKTLVATLPVYLNALTGRGVHLVTVNNYLARRDSQWMGHVYQYLGLTVGCLDDTEPSSLARHAAYRCDVTHGTNNEFGFDYLRDNMVYQLEQRVQRDHIYAIIDEVDSILIDEARTPLIISGPVGTSENEKYALYNDTVAQLIRQQTEIVNATLSEAQRLLENDDTRYEGAVKLYQAHLGMPKNKRLLKMLNEQGLKQQLQRVELDSIADRKLPIRKQQMRGIEDTLLFVLDEKGHSVHLTDQGAERLSPDDPDLFIVPDISEIIHEIERDESRSAVEKTEARRQVESEYAVKSEKLHIIHKLLQAYALYEKDIDYLVQDSQVLIVDEFTGRALPGRRWADGLHQAVEAKEKVEVKGETQTLATITIQNYFRMYQKLAGMTGTAETEETEFYSIYKLDVMVIPTHEPIRRVDHPDQIFKTRREKNTAIIDEVERLHEAGRPVLIGTVSVEMSESLSRQLKRRGVRHEVLNAKFHQREAEIVAKAGMYGAATIATNMAGRGTDIKLGEGVDIKSDEGGLQIIGTERHESRRIDRQLRGRSGRQGDPGNTRFFLSLEDNLMRLFISDRVASWIDKSGVEDGEVITGKLVTRSIEQAQKRVELQNFQSRKRLLEYDDVMNQQREVIYSLRLGALERGEEVKATARRMIAMGVQRTVAEFLDDAESPEEFDLEGLTGDLTLRYVFTVDALADTEATPDRDAVEQAVLDEAESAFTRKLDYLTDFGKTINATDVDRQVLSQVMLKVLDDKWKDHLYDLDLLRHAIQYRAYGQRDPLMEYKKDAFEMFEDLMEDINTTFAEQFFKVQLTAGSQPAARGGQRPPPPPTPQDEMDELLPGATPVMAGAGALAGMAPPPPPPGTPNAPSAAPLPGRRQSGDPYAGVGRNDPCPCGSGKKFKKCHGR
ncbi:MAG: preprotein translocase subunit SecA [Gemmatimonadetes bacterium]|nr:MAG: preprotein translocase subunit SecA [Gemmatimonadota bacterium]